MPPRNPISSRTSFLFGLLAAATLGSQVACAECLAWRSFAAAGPAPRGESGMAYDSVRQRTVLVGGARSLSFAQVFRDTWEWDGAAWTLRATDGPAQRCDQAMAFDGARGVVVLFGGYNGTYLADTWEWDGVVWQQRSVSGPSARADSFMVYDSTRGVMVLFGGQAANGAILGDTWEWDGTVWQQRVATGPPNRWIHRMAFDRQRGVTVLFGGAAPGGLLRDTWEWDGAIWTARGTGGPPARYGHGMAYDSVRQRTVLFGGQTGFNFGVGVLGDTWEWDGASWTQIPASGPTPRSFVKLVYDSARREIVLFGGYNGQAFVGDTWELGTDVAISQSPVNRGTVAGGAASFSVSAGGTEPLQYHWRRNQVVLSDDGHRSGALSATLDIDPVTAADEGEYDAVVANDCGERISEAALLRVVSRSDANCDGAIDFFDIDPFLLALLDPATYPAVHPDCDIATADLNGDAAVNFSDIDPFLACLFDGPCS